MTGVGGGEAERVDEQVGAIANDAGESRRVMSVGGVKPRAASHEVSRHPQRVASDEIDRPLCGEQSPRRRTSEDAGSSKNHSPGHRPRLTSTVARHQVGSRGDERSEGE